MPGRNILQSIGQTPLVQLKKLAPEGGAAIYVKLEYFNPTGSYKDRLALGLIGEAEKRGDIQPGMTIVECTGGSTGSSLALVCSVKGYHFKVISSDAFAKEKLQVMRLFGADLELIHSETGMITPDLIPMMIARAEELSRQRNTYWTRQFENLDGLTYYREMGKEIIQQLNARVDVFCAAVGTAGMYRGVWEELINANPSMNGIVLEPASAPLLSMGIKGSHKVEGIGMGMVPPLLERSHYHEVKTIEEANAREMARLLASREGIFAGISTGMNVVAAIELAKKLRPDQTVVTVACDSGLKYLASGLFD